MTDFPTYDLQVILDTLFKTRKVYPGLGNGTLTDIPGTVLGKLDPPIDISNIKSLPEWDIGFEPRRYKRSYPKQPLIAYEPHIQTSSKELTAEVDEDALMNYLKARYPTSYLYLKTGVGVIDRGSAILSLEEFLPKDRVDALRAVKIAIAKAAKEAADAGKPRIVKLTDSCALMYTACYPTYDYGIWRSIQMADVSGHLNGGRYTNRRTKSGKVPRNSHDDVEDNFVPTHVVSIWGPGIIDWISPTVPFKHPWDRSPDEPWTLAEVDVLHAEVLTDSDPTTHYTYTRFPKEPVTVVAKHVKHNEQWYAKYLRLLGRGAPSPVLMAGKAVTCKVKAFMCPAGRSLKLIEDAWCGECRGTVRYSRLGDAFCEDCGLISDYPGIDEFEDGYVEGPSTIDYEPLSNFKVGARAKDFVEASTIPAGDLVHGNGIHIGGKVGVAALVKEAHSLSTATKGKAESKTVINLALGGKPLSRRYSTVRNSYSALVIRARVSVLSGVVRGYMGAIQGVATEVTYGRILDEVRDWERANRCILPESEVKHGVKPESYNAVDTCREEGWLSIVIQHIKLAARDGTKLTAADLVKVTGLTRKEVDLCNDILSGTRIRRRTGVCGQPRIKIIPRGRNKLLKLIRS